MERVLVNSDKYNGKYVAFISVEDNTIISSGQTPAEVLTAAKNKGYQNPYLLFVPAEDLVHIYYAG
jgi:archaellum component FlaG (FlaF/FlaG flagellin family)